jgi:heme-degrading monooxygenase HmoA
MAQLFVQHKVADYSKWRKIFDDMTATRTSYGMSAQQVFHSAADPNEIVILTHWPSVEKAQAYAQSPEIKTAMQNGGVLSQPNVLFLEEV